MKNLTAFYGTTSFALLILLIFTGWFANEQMSDAKQQRDLRATEKAAYDSIEKKHSDSLNSINNNYYICPKSNQYHYGRTKKN